MDELKKDLGKRLAEIRKSKKIKQEELKEMIGAPTVQMISGWENGHSFPSPFYLINLAKKLDISLDYLLLGKENEKNKKKIFTYKDAVENIIELNNSELFYINDYKSINDIHCTVLESHDKTIAKFKEELDNLLIAKQTLRNELFNQAIDDLINKYDIPLNNK